RGGGGDPSHRPRAPRQWNAEALTLTGKRPRCSRSESLQEARARTGNHKTLRSARAQVLLSMMTDFENFATFKPHLHHEKHLGTVLDQVVAWGGALKQLR